MKVRYQFRFLFPYFQLSAYALISVPSVIEKWFSFLLHDLPMESSCDLIDLLHPGRTEISRYLSHTASFFYT